MDELKYKSICKNLDGSIDTSDCTLDENNNFSAVNSHEGGGGGSASTSLVVAPEYDETADYVVGDLAAHDNLLYECNTAITGGEEWNPEHWTQTTVSESVIGLINTGV